MIVFFDFEKVGKISIFFGNFGKFFEKIVSIKTTNFENFRKFFLKNIQLKFLMGTFFEKFFLKGAYGAQFWALCAKNLALNPKFDGGKISNMHSLNVYSWSPNSFLINTRGTWGAPQDFGRLN